MGRVTGEIKALSEQYSFRRIDEDHVALAPYGRGTDDGFFFWGELTRAHMRDALAKGIDWEGFAEAQEQDVILRVADGQGPGSWMDGVEADAPRDERSADSMPREGLGGEERDDLRIESHRRDLAGTSREDAGREDARAEPEARIGDFKHIGDDDPNPGRDRRRSGLAEDAKPNQIKREARELHLESEPAAYAVVARAVDLARLPVEMRREFEEGWAKARTGPVGGLGGKASEKPDAVAVDDKAVPSPSEIAAGTRAVGTRHGGEQWNQRLAIPSEIAGDSHVERAESQHGPESDKGHGR
jgi:hypothetical protein